MIKEIIALLWVLLITVLILGLAYWFTRHVVGRMAGGLQLGGRQIEILEQVAVNRDQKLLLVRMGEQFCFMASAQGSLTVIRTLTQQEIDALPSPAAGPAKGESSFAKALRQVLEQRKK